MLARLRQQLDDETALSPALRVPCSDIRLFGKPEAYLRRRMGVALAYGNNVREARERAKLAASMVRPVAGKK